MASARTVGCSKWNRHISKYVEEAGPVRSSFVFLGALSVGAPHMAAIVSALVAQNHAQ
jgi:hypothetical protein